MGTVSVLPGVDPQVFWGEMAPCEHVVQIYGDDSVFLDGLEGFIGGALRARESAIVIATAGHLHGLERRMRDRGIDVERTREEGRFIACLAEETMEQFMVKGWPDEALFQETVNKLILKARGDSGRKVRAFGEMVAIMWARGEFAATIELEQLWSKLCKAEQFPLFCAYPRNGFTRNATESIVDICKAHSRVIPAAQGGD